jgi:hypothetical protein
MNFSHWMSQLHPGRGHQGMLHSHDDLGPDAQVAFHEQFVGLRQRAGQRVLHRQHAQVGPSLLHCLEDTLQ